MSKGKRTAEKLTEARIRAARPKPGGLKLPDGHGLYLHISPADGRAWRYGFRWPDPAETDGKTGRPKLRAQTLTLGNYPEMTLAEARAAHADARRLLAKGVNPAAAKSAAKRGAPLAGAEDAECVTFKALAEAFLERQARGLKPASLANARRCLERHILPALGRRPAAAIEALEIRRRVIEPHLKAGSFNLARRLMCIVGQVYRSAQTEGLKLADPTAPLSLREDLKGYRPRPRAALESPEAAGELMRLLDGHRGEASVRNALRLAPYVFLRPSELRGARWAEIDMERGVWTIPGGRMKAGEDHAVPLSSQALAVLREQREVSGRLEHVFPGHDPLKAISRDSLLKAIRRLGYGPEEMTPHGFRGMASTMLNGLGFRPDWIEAQLAHREPNQVRRAYNRAGYLEDRAMMMQSWADYLDGLKAGGAEAGEAEARARKAARG
ncbi:MAG: tyrosine-type recombinase/integrase [Deltaproteobacteria bacterium]|jgi:integrase|nr:tyrosine-type recombinase/integrase [Deltaproteobacteria bacterium]